MPQRREGWGGEGEGQLGNLLTEYSRVYLLHGAKILSRHLSTRCNPLTLPHENLTYLTNTLKHPLTYVCTPVKRHKHTPPIHWKPLIWPHYALDPLTHTLDIRKYPDICAISIHTLTSHKTHPLVTPTLWIHVVLAIHWVPVTCCMRPCYIRDRAVVYYYCWYHQHWTHKQIAS